jgi:hypothetical protein
MEDERRILEEVEKTLHSLEDDGVLKGNPFLYTKLKALLEVQPRGHRYRLTLRMGVQLAVMLLVLLVNLLTVIHVEGEPATDLRDQLVSELKAELQIEQSQSNF